MSLQRILVTGGAGFIGSHLTRRLLQAGHRVRVLDNLDPFYDPAIKRSNLAALQSAAGAECEFQEGDIRDPQACCTAVEGVDAVVHLAALAGVRPSIVEPTRYMDVNVTGTQVLLQALHQRAQSSASVPFVFGSSSSVYGGNEKVPFAEQDPVDRPISPYAASKRAGELICRTYQTIHGSPVTCLRLFTVYGPGQRPEMAIHRFVRCILAGETMPFYGDGGSRRDYTYVDDVVDGMLAALDRARGYSLYNLGGSSTTSLADLVHTLEKILGHKAVLEHAPPQAGDVLMTWADIRRAETELGYTCKVNLEEGLQRFCDWYRAREAGQ